MRPRSSINKQMEDSETKATMIEQHRKQKASPPAMENCKYVVCCTVVE